jgi:hypothetical protein
MTAIETAVTQAFGEGETSGKALGTAAGMTAGATAERARSKTIMSSEHAKGREPMAQHLAFETDMSAEAANRRFHTDNSTSFLERT